MPGFAAIAFLAVLVSPPGAAAQTDALLESLEPQGYVSDFTGVIGASRAPLEALLAELEQKTGAEIAVVALASLEGGEPADFANRLFERWGVGQAGADNGLLILAAIEDREIRMEVGYGLEPVITDARAGRILDEQVLPAFRQERYGEGLVLGAAAAAAIIAADAGVELTGDAPFLGEGRSSRFGGLLRIVLFLLLIPILIRNPWLALLLMSGRGGGGHRGGGGFGRGGGGGFGGFGGGMSGGGGAGRSW